MSPATRCEEKLSRTARTLNEKTRSTEAKWAGMAQMSRAAREEQHSNTDSYQGRTTKERWVSDNMRKRTKEKSKKDEDIEKICLL